MKETRMGIHLLAAVAFAFAAARGVGVAGAEEKVPKPAVAELAAKLNGNILHGRRAAVEYLGRMGPEASDAVPSLVKAMAADEDLTVRLRAAWALGEIGEPAEVIVPGLIAALDDPEPAVRINATKSLVELGDVSRAALMTAVDADETSDLIRAGCLDALTSSGATPTELVAANIIRLSASEDASARTTAALVAGRLDREAAVTLQPAVWKMINDTDANVQRAAIAAATGLSIPSGPPAELIDALATALAKSKDKQVRMEAADALGKLGKSNPEPAIEALYGVLVADKDKRIILSTGNALGAVGAPALPRLEEGLKHPDRRVREAAMDGICLIPESGSDAARKLLLNSLSDPEWTVRAKAAHALGNGSPEDAEVVNALTAASTADQEATVRNAATTALSRLKPTADSAAR